MRKHALMIGRKKNIFLVGHGRRFVHLNSKSGSGSGQRRIDFEPMNISTTAKRGPIRLKFNKLQI